MQERAEKRAAFIGATAWRDAENTPLAGDASRRRYFRLYDRETARHAIVMDAPPALGEDVRPFLRVGRYLADLGLSAPEIFEADEDQGFLIMEDFGDDLFDAVCARSLQMEAELYSHATEVLAFLAQAPLLGGIRDYREDMRALALTSLRWYVEGATGLLDAGATAQMSDALTPLLGAGLAGSGCTVLRDFHAQNLVWLPKRSGVQRIGLLDFQDAMMGPAAYDLMSLLHDARRDVSAQVIAQSMAQFAALTGVAPEDLAREAAICSAQRNLRILMVFARMSLHFGKPDYVDFIPRTWAHLQRDLAHPDLAALREVVAAIYPEPTADVLEGLKAKCGTIPTL